MPATARPPMRANAICFRVSSAYADSIKKSALTNAVATIRERINEKGVAEPSVVEKGDEIIVELPGIDEDVINETRDIIARTAKLEFKVVDDGSEYMKQLFAHVGSEGKEGKPTDPDAIKARHQRRDRPVAARGGRRQSRRLLPDRARSRGGRQRRRSEGDGLHQQGQPHQGRGRQDALQRHRPEGDRALPVRRRTAQGREGPVVQGPRRSPDRLRAQRAEPRGQGQAHVLAHLLPRARRAPDRLRRSRTRWAASIRTRIARSCSLDFNRYGSRVFGDLTSQIVGKKLATILDDKVKSAPIINGAIRGGRASITMGGSDARRAGEGAQRARQRAQDRLACPRRSARSRRRKIGATLGRDAIEKTRLSFIIGIVARRPDHGRHLPWSGWIAVFAVVFHIVMTLAVMALFGATLTLARHRRDRAVDRHGGGRQHPDLRTNP